VFARAKPSRFAFDHQSEEIRVLQPYSRATNAHMELSRPVHVLLLLLLARAADASPLAALQPKYDVIIVGTGIKESLLAGLLSQHGKLVLQIEPSEALGGASRSIDLQKLANELDGPGAALSEQKLGKPSEYLIEREPKMFMAAGAQLQLLTASGAWQHMNPPGFKRVQRSLIYRQRADGTADVHRVLANSEDVVKTRMLAPLEKARVLQFFHWVERYVEADARTHLAGPLSKRQLDLRKMSAAKFLAFWELPADAAHMISRGMALQQGALKKVPALEFVRRLKRYKDAYRTFPHMTSPYVYPVGGFGSTLASAMAGVLESHGGTCLVGQPLTGLLSAGAESGGAMGVKTADGVPLRAECVVCAPEHAAALAPGAVQPAYEVVRLYAVLAHPPNLCKEATSCQLILPAAAIGREHDAYMCAFGPTHGVAPAGRWVVVASARVEGPTAGMDALAIAKRELAAVLPLLKPSRKLLAEVRTVYQPTPDGVPDGLHVLHSSDESTYFDSVEVDVESTFTRITGEKVASLRRP
jgi:Rab GDP dissociation inhibitor